MEGSFFDRTKIWRIIGRDGRKNKKGSRKDKKGHPRRRKGMRCGLCHGKDHGRAHISGKKDKRHPRTARTRYASVNRRTGDGSITFHCAKRIGHTLCLFKCPSIGNDNDTRFQQRTHNRYKYGKADGRI